MRTYCRSIAGVMSTVGCDMMLNAEFEIMSMVVAEIAENVAGGGRESKDNIADAGELSSDCRLGTSCLTPDTLLATTSNASKAVRDSFSEGIDLCWSTTFIVDCTCSKSSSDGAVPL